MHTNQVRRPSLIDIYRNDTGDQAAELFLRVIKKPKNLNRIAEKLPEMSQIHFYGGQLILKNPNIKPITSELMISEAFLRVGVAVMFEPVRFNFNRKGLSYHPDIWPNIYLKNRDTTQIVLMENHPFEKPRIKASYRLENMASSGTFDPETLDRMVEQNLKKELSVINKMIAMHSAHPELFFILRSDMRLEDFKSEFGISDINSVCDEYRVDRNGFRGIDTVHKFDSKMRELKKEMRDTRRMPGARLQKDIQKWHSDVSEIIRKELIKALQ